LGAHSCAVDGPLVRIPNKPVLNDGNPELVLWDDSTTQMDRVYQCHMYVRVHMVADILALMKKTAVSKNQSVDLYLTIVRPIYALSLPVDLYNNNNNNNNNNHRQRGSDCTVLTATGLVNGECTKSKPLNG